MNGQQRLSAHLRNLRAHDSAPLSVLVRIVASELVSEVCSIYVQRPQATSWNSRRPRG